MLLKSSFHQRSKQQKLILNKYLEKTKSGGYFQESDEVLVIMNHNKKILYFQPKMFSTLKYETKAFHPLQWNITNFQIGRRLGRGKYGYVYLVRQKQTKMILALKILEKNKIIKQDVMVQVRRQIEVHSHMNHPNILKMYGFFFDDQRLYIMLEYATRGDLYNRLRKNNGFDQKTVQNYIRQMVDAFVYLQGFNIIHRDIKPENILISSNDTLKISDFGLAIKTTAKNRNTFCGTLDYFCPQIVNYKPFDYKIDNWSLGVLAYELLVGKSPFYATTKKEFYSNILYNSIKFPGKASQNFIDFVQKLTRKKASERMQLKQALNHPWLNKQIEKMDIELPTRQPIFKFKF